MNVKKPVKMDLSSQLYAALGTVISLLLCVLSREVMVKQSDLKLCGNNLVCVTDPNDCGPPPPLSEQKTLNMSCYYHSSEESMTCQLSEDLNSHTESDVSLIFSRTRTIFSCRKIFNPAARLTITARIKNYMTGGEIWSRLHNVSLCEAVKHSPPVVSVLKCTEDSVTLSWECNAVCSEGCNCVLRYGVNNAPIWTQAPDSVSTSHKPTLTYTIRDLRPFTVYRAAVSCAEMSGIWSEWSADITARTQDRVPSRPPEVCYRVEKNNSGASFHLHLMWKDFDLQEAGGRILGYQVSFEQVNKNQLHERFSQNVTELTALLVVEAGTYSVTVRAFNMAGFGPPSRLSIDTRRQITLPVISNLWVSSATKSFLVQWEPPTVPPHSVPPVTYFTVQWRSETSPFTSRWTTVDNFTTSIIIKDVGPYEYLITVFPVYNQQFGSPQSLRASLQKGALKEAVKLKVVSATKTTVTVECVWQLKSGSSRVDRYSAALWRDSEGQTLSLWPNQLQHTFINLKPSTEYSLLLLADNNSINITPVKTEFDELPVVATATPLLLLAVILFIISILSRTVYKSYFFPLISSPRGSTTGQWLMDSKHQKPAERNVLDIEDFQVRDILGEKRIISVGLNSESTLEEELHEDTSLLSSSHLIIKLGSEYVCDAPVFAEPVLASPQSSYHPVYIANCHHADPNHEDHTSEESHEESASPFDERVFPQKEEESRWVCEISHEKEMAVKSLLSEFMANREHPCVYQMSCEAGYVVNSSSFQGKSDVETESGRTNCSSLVCENDYIANSCFQVNNADEDRRKRGGVC